MAGAAHPLPLSATAACTVRELFQKEGGENKKKREQSKVLWNGNRWRMKAGELFFHLGANALAVAHGGCIARDLIG